MATVHGSRAIAWVNGVSLTTALNKLSPKMSMDAAETSTFGQNAKSYIPGLIDNVLSGEGLFDGSANAVDAQLRAIFATSSIWAVNLSGSDTVGNTEIGLQGITEYGIDADIGGAVKISFDVQQSTGGYEPGAIILLVTDASAATFTTGAVDQTAATTNGGTMFVHVSAVSGGSPTATYQLQHSTDNITFPSVSGAVTTAFTAVGAQRIVIPPGTTLNRYVRVQRVVGGTTPSFTSRVTLCRK